MDDQAIRARLLFDAEYRYAYELGRAEERDSRMTWTSTDGTEIPLIRLEDTHLQNIERMLRGDGSKQPESLTDEETVRQHGMVLREMSRRGLSPLPWIRDQPPQPKPYRVTWVGVDVNLVRFMRILAHRRGVDDHVVANEAMLDYVSKHQDEIKDVLKDILNRNTGPAE